MDEGKVIYKDLSYQIIGCLFEVYNNLGFGHREKYYQQAVCNEFERQKIEFTRELAIDLNYKGERVGKNYLDFFIENKIVLELKVGSQFNKKNLEQVLGYIKAKDLKLGIIANFTRDGLKYYRVLNA